MKENIARDSAGCGSTASFCGSASPARQSALMPASCSVDNERGGKGAGSGTGAGARAGADRPWPAGGTPPAEHECFDIQQRLKNKYSRWSEYQHTTTFLSRCTWAGGDDLHTQRCQKFLVAGADAQGNRVHLTGSSLQTLPAECWCVDFAFRPQKALQLETLFGGLGYPQPPEANSYAGLQVWPLGVTPASKRFRLDLVFTGLPPEIVFAFRCHEPIRERSAKCISPNRFLT